jgi:ribosomal protein L17
MTPVDRQHRERWLANRTRDQKVKNDLLAKVSARYYHMRQAGYR